MQVLLADDHGMVREALAPIIRRIGEHVEVLEAESFHQALQIAEGADDLKLFILDLSMPGMNDMVGLRRVASLYPGIPIVILSGLANPNTIIRTIKNGASGFIPKTYGGQALISALRIVLSGERYVPSSVFLEGEISVEPGRKTNLVVDARGLSQEEHETLNQLKEGKSNKEIAADLGVQEVTVKKRLGRVYKKLGVSNRTQATRIALELGLED